MGVVLQLAALAVTIFFVILLVRMVLDWVQVFARDWRPRGVALVVAEVTYTVTDPPLKALRRLIPPVTIGQIRLDLAFMVLFLACLFLMSMLPALAATL
ncbi:YggT family protein [Cellulomonas composti]|uniref:YggT family protein n=1 Tax=Cellulomonas composti TaxID=266130 RepID=A0A511J8D8_9CELL|nr:YggT family protein [Cellulomonas composti]GEL94234.1 YggT family protein [Cellulomonas composti]